MPDVDAPTAVSWGLANACVPAAELRARARQVAETIAEKPPMAVSNTKKLMRDVGKLAARIEEEGVHFQAQARSAEGREAIAAFKEKRKPNFSGAV